MTTIILTAFLTVAVTAWLVHPLMKSGERKRAVIVIIVLPLSALALYLWQGRPDLPAAPALFEHDGPRAAVRQLAKDELRLTQALSQKPGDEELKAQLGEVFYARGLAVFAVEGDAERAVEYLDNALSVAPENVPYRKQLQADRRRMETVSSAE